MCNGTCNAPDPKRARTILQWRRALTGSRDLPPVIRLQALRALRRYDDLTPSEAVELRRMEGTA